MSRDRAEAFVAVAAFAVLCVVVLSSAARLVEPDDYAYRASIVAIICDCGTLAGESSSALPGSRLLPGTS